MTAPNAAKRAAMARLGEVATLLESLSKIRLDGEGPNGEEDDEFFMENDDAHDDLTAYVQDARAILRRP